jgi:hypothetical protein
MLLQYISRHLRYKLPVQLIQHLTFFVGLQRLLIDRRLKLIVSSQVSIDVFSNVLNNNISIKFFSLLRSGLLNSGFFAVMHNRIISNIHLFFLLLFVKVILSFHKYYLELLNIEFNN